MKNVFFCCILLLASLRGIAGALDEVRALPAQQRMARVQEIYNKQLRFADSSTGIAALKELVGMAESLKDKSLQCFSRSLLADMYARHRKANPLSTQLHQEAIAMAERFDLPLMTGICSYRLGRYYYSFKNYPLAFEYMLRADNIFRELGYLTVPDIDEILFIIGSTYYETGDLEKAESFLQKVQTLKQINNYVRKQSLNTLALIRRAQGDTTAALRYFEQTLLAAQQQNDSAWIGISYGNIGAIYYAQGKPAQAYPMLASAARLTKAYRQWNEAYANTLLMARIDIRQNHLSLAKEKIDSAANLRQLVPTPQTRRLMYETLVELYEKEGRPSEALAVQHRLMLVKDSISIAKDKQAYQKILLRLETEKHLNAIDKIEAESRQSTLQRNTVIVVLGLMLVVLFLLFNRSRLKALNQAAVLQAEKMRAEEQLQTARQMLHNFTENSRQKNELIEQFAAELQRLKSNLTGDPLYEERLNNFDKLVHSTILSDAEWNNFRALFDKVHKGFFQRLGQKLPGLSLNDTRLVSLLKLELSNREMARMLGMQEDAVAQAKQRLREKIHPGADGLALEDLVQAI